MYIIILLTVYLTNDLILSWNFIMCKMIIIFNLNSRKDDLGNYAGNQKTFFFRLKKE